MIKICTKWVLMILLLLSFLVGGTYVWLRYHDNLTHRGELVEVRRFLTSVIESDVPSREWINNCDPAGDPLRTFYFFKVWFAEAGVTPRMLNWAFIDYPVMQLGPDKTSFSLNYGRHLPTIECRVTVVNGAKRIWPRFSLNNCLFHPDYNNDGKWNMEDVLLARKVHESIQQGR